MIVSKVMAESLLVLPRQYDGSSCGIGIAAGIAIVLNSLLGPNAAADKNGLEPTLTNEGEIQQVKNVHSSFSSTFQCENLEVHMKKMDDDVEEAEEAICYFPKELFPPLPCDPKQYLVSLKSSGLFFLTDLPVCNMWWFPGGSMQTPKSQWVMNSRRKN